MADQMLDDILALDLATLQDWRSDVPKPLDPTQHRAALLAGEAVSTTLTVYDAKSLRGYVRLQPMQDGVWFVTGLAIAPGSRGLGVPRALLRKMQRLIAAERITSLVSNVYRGNHASLSLHKALGFTATRENDVGYELTLAATSLTARAKRA